MMKGIFKLVILFFVATNSYGQVNLQTGSATQGISLFEWKDNKSSLELSVSLNYSSGNGLKVDDVASNIGQGWDIVAGGVINRIQVGEPDDQQPKEGNYANSKKYPAGYLYSTTDATLGCPSALAKYPLFGLPNQLYRQHNSVAADRELDYFSFQFNGHSGVFILGKNNGDKGVTIGDSKLKIWFERSQLLVNQGIRTTISVFYIQDENGLIYKFGNLSLSKITTPSRNNANFDNKGVYFETTNDNLFLTDNPYVVNGWYLSEIKDPFTNRVITFNYETRNISNKNGQTINLFATPYMANPNPNLFAGGTTFSVAPKQHITVTERKAILVTPVLSSISYPDGHYLYCEFGKNRIDWNGDKILKNIFVKYLNRFVTAFEFTTTYFIKNTYGEPVTSQDKQFARLCLRSMRKIGPDLKDVELPITFDYYLGSSATDDFVPAPFYYIKDIWGYYNGDYSYNDPQIVYLDNLVVPISLNSSDLKDLSFNQLMILCFKPLNLRKLIINPKQGYAKNGLLKSISNPLGGKFVYEYEQNKGNLKNTGDIYVGGVSVSKTISISGEGTPDIVTKYDYKESDNSSSLWGLELPENRVDAISNYRREDKTFYVYNTDCGGLACCDWGYKYPGVEQVTNSESDVKAGNTADKVALAVKLIGGHFASSKLLNPKGVKDLKAFNKAVLVNSIVQLMFEILASILNTCEASEYYTHTIIYNNSNLNDVNPLPTQFKRVEIQQIGVLDNGKTVQTFTSPADYALWENSNPMFTNKQRFAPWAYGLPLKTSIYDKNNNLVRETSNVYDFSNNSKKEIIQNETSVKSCNCFVKATHSLNINDWNNPSVYDNSNSLLINSNDDISVNMYNYYTGHVDLIQANERIYKPGSAVLNHETRSEYEYNTNNFQIKKATTTNSNGDKHITETYFTSDYSLSGIIQTLKDNNVLGLPVASYKSIIRAGQNTPLYLEANIVDFVNTNAGIRAKRSLVSRNAQPVSSFQFNSSNLYNFPNLVETKSFTYNANGSLVGVNDEGGHKITNILDYDDKIVVAEVVNANSQLDKCAYTSFETNNLNGWVINGTPTYSSSFYATGTRSLILNDIDLAPPCGLSTNIPINTNYTLSFWAGSLIDIPYAQIVKSSPTINGMTYYEYDVPAGTPYISIQAHTTIDELRLYPKVARMRTITYDPLIGKTSECDENNRIKFYEYDLLGRLRFIKDYKGNIVKMYEYNTKK